MAYTKPRMILLLNALSAVQASPEIKVACALLDCRAGEYLTTVSAYEADE